MFLFLIMMRISLLDLLAQECVHVCVCACLCTCEREARGQLSRSQLFPFLYMGARDRTQHLYPLSELSPAQGIHLKFKHSCIEESQAQSQLGLHHKPCLKRKQTWREKNISQTTNKGWVSVLLHQRGGSLCNPPCPGTQYAHHAGLEHTNNTCLPSQVLGKTLLKSSYHLEVYNGITYCFQLMIVRFIFYITANLHI